jgi:hypothetical protein
MEKLQSVLVPTTVGSSEGRRGELRGGAIDSSLEEIYSKLLRTVVVVVLAAAKAPERLKVETPSFWLRPSSHSSEAIW